MVGCHWQVHVRVPLLGGGWGAVVGWHGGVCYGRVLLRVPGWGGMVRCHSGVHCCLRWRVPFALFGRPWAGAMAVASF